MTRDYFRKKAVRDHAAATDRAYLDAERSLTASRSAGLALAGDLRDRLAAGLVAAGCPVEVEHNPQDAGLRIYAGPATISVERQNSLTIFTGDEHPDDPDVFDLTMPLAVLVWAPLVGEYSEELKRVFGVDGHEIAADRTVAAIITEIDCVVGQARQRDLADLSADTECGICGDQYPAVGLFNPTKAEISVCPCCAFDGDLLGASPERLAFEIDKAVCGNLAVPAGWAGAQALLSCL
ncbi:hypothetical protein [Nocardia sp. NPDC004860]|uniref:hypothetical protein n=1 Tax=Nocardia sp. NPDC004860 TaxID=3154557 RepID=UPI0033B15B2F